MPKEQYGAWPKIAECLPDRSVQACHNLCKRRFNPDNYGGRWTQEEEGLLLEYVNRFGESWKRIADELNDLGSVNKRTATNVKDKYKSLGSTSSNTRNIGPWSIKEAIQLFNTVCLATEAPEKIFKEGVEVIYEEENKKELFKIEDKTIVIYQPFRVSVDQLFPHLIRLKKAKEYFVEKHTVISWLAVQKAIPTRSADDIRQFWNLKIVPLLCRS